MEVLKIDQKNHYGEHMMGIVRWLIVIIFSCDWQNKLQRLTDASWALDTTVSYVGGRLKDFSTCSFKFASVKENKK